MRSGPSGNAATKCTAVVVPCYTQPARFDGLGVSVAEDGKKEPWLKQLAAAVENKPIAVLRFSKEEWQDLSESRGGTHEFTIVRQRALLKKIKPSTVCIFEGGGSLRLGIVSSSQSVASIQHRIKIKRALQIDPKSERALERLITDKALATVLKARLAQATEVVQLSPNVSVQIVEALASIEVNHGAMRAISSYLSTPRKFHGAASLQQDAVQMALRAFGLTTDDEALEVLLTKRDETGLARINVIEDSVIEHEARSVPGYDLVGSDMTGKAVFERAGEQLEIYTANRRSLERTFGVDLIYVNLTQQNVVMVQYKMLEVEGRHEDSLDWVYRPDSQLDAEINRMEQFCHQNSPGPLEYRLNASAFYLKFVKRDAKLNTGGIVTPIEHYRIARGDPSCRGHRGGIRISYQGLKGRYLRQSAFFDLIRSGYIGAYANDAKRLKIIIDAILGGNRALVLAIQEAIDRS